VAAFAEERLSSEEMASAFLQTRPRCAFTCARPISSSTNTTELVPIVGKEYHIQRLISSYKELFMSETTTTTMANDRAKKRLKLDEEAFAQRLEKNFEPLTNYNSLLVVLAYPDPETEEPCIERKEFPFSFSSRMEVNLVVVGHGGPRIHPKAKDSGWIAARKPLELVKGKYGADELILSEKSASGSLCLFEGLITNFFIVLKGKNWVMTAPDDVVLEGTMRRLVIDCLRDIDFEVILEAPNWDNRDEWAAAFLTSVTKPCAFIKRIVNVEEEAKLETLNLDLFNEVVETISTAVELAISSASQ
jgi:hypothetical protein